MFVTLVLGSLLCCTLTARNQPWRALAFLPLLTSSLLTKIHIIYTQLLQKEKISPVMPRSEWLAEWSLKYAQECSKSWVKNSEQNFLPLHVATRGSNLPRLDEAFLEVFLTPREPSRRPITAAKRKKRRKKEKRKKLKNRKAFRRRSLSHLQILISAHAGAKMSKNAMLVARGANCFVANAFLTRSNLIWPKSSLKTTKMSKKCIFGKKLRESIG